RPLRRVAAAFDDIPIDGVVSASGTEFPLLDYTYAHRFGGAKIAVKNAHQFLQNLRNNHVMPSRNERREAILEEFAGIETKHHITIIPDAQLCDEVVGLVESVDCLIGSIDKKFLLLPEEILISAMRSHQRYFATRDQTGHVAPHYVFVSNLPKVAGAQANIIHGNDRVLRARLADAMFFWKHDCEMTLENMATQLANVSFFDRLGTLADKSARLAQSGLAIITHELDPAHYNAQDFVKAANLCKADLCAQTVGEFPELQGIIGGLLLDHAGVNKKIANAVRNHYMPQSSSDPMPKDIGSVLALADKLDTLVGFFMIGMTPSGSKDPFALRRAGLGIVRILDETLPIHALLPMTEQAILLYRAQNLPDQSIEADDTKIANEIVTFLLERLKTGLRAQNYAHDHIAAALGSNAFGQDVPVLGHVLEALANFVAKQDNMPLLLSIKRIRNILQKSDAPARTAINPEYFQDICEEDLWKCCTQVSKDFAGHISKHDFVGALDCLCPLQAPVDKYFDVVLINDSD
ncbi:MAG: glycine--tRNA ligase subunit beta, partial [Pseudomonadota bacterium]